MWGITMAEPFTWPDGKRCAVSFSFDDARPSQLELGLPILDDFDIRATFYVCIPPLRESSRAWRAAFDRGHEVGNHTINHPCSANYHWCKVHIEDYSLEQMDRELDDAQRVINDAINVLPSTFAYPCGNTWVGRGGHTQCYVPLVNRRFLAGRGFRNETTNKPQLVDLAHVAGVDADRHPFETLRLWIDRTIERGAWLCFVNHDVSPTLDQAIKPATLRRACEYVREHQTVWVDTVANVARHIRTTRGPVA
jgi:hypothetical protein